MKTMMVLAMGAAAFMAYAPPNALAQGGPPPMPMTAAPPPIPVTPSAQYFYNDNGTQSGPYTLD